nr:MAG TPA: hypothetical protein [Caudoviricetes sp.]
MTRYFCGMWEYKTQIMNYIHAESFLANLILKRRSLHICICDKNWNAVASVRFTSSDVYKIHNRSCVTGLILYDTHYRVKADSFKNVFLVPIH